MSVVSIPAPPGSTSASPGVAARWLPRARVSVKLLASTYLWTLLWLVTWVVVPAVLGWAPLAIQSGSMVPSLDVGDVILIGQVEPEHLVANTIITYTDPTRSGDLVTHRIIDVNSDGTLVTKGDANRDPDSDPVPRDAIEGMGRAVVPAIGLPMVWATTGRIDLFIAFLALTGAAALGAGMRLGPPTDAAAPFSPPRSASIRPPDGPVATRTGTWSPPATPPTDPAPRRQTRVIPPLGRRGVVAVLIIALVSASSISVAMFGTTRSAFAGSEPASGNFVMGVVVGDYVSTVTADSPIAWWRLDDVGATTTTPDQPIFSSGLETQNWNNEGAGITRVLTPVLNGTWAGSTTATGGPSGGYWSYPATTSTRWRLTSHHNLGTGGRVSVFASNANVSGYGAAIDENDVLEIIRFDNQSPTVIASQALPATPANQWIRLVLDRDGSAFTATATIVATDQLLGTVTATDATHTGAQYMDVYQLANTGVVDDIAIIIPGTTTTAPATTAVDSTGNEPDATPTGGIASGQPGLIGSGTSFDFDGVDDLVQVPDSPAINTQGRYDARTIEVWFNADDVSGATEQMLYEEGGNSNGISIWLAGNTLYLETWSNNWSNSLLVSTAVQSGTTYQAVMVLDAIGDTLTGYLNGSPFGTSTKTDGRGLNSHSANIGIGGMNGAARTNGSPNGGNGLYFDGRIDEVSLYATALSAARVQAHYTAGLAG